MTYQCPTCGRVSESGRACRGSREAPHPPRAVAPAEDLSEALHVEEPIAGVARNQP